jgi:hypothetical protein
MKRARITVGGLTIGGVAFGFLLAYRWPASPLLAYWLLLGIFLGLVVTFFSQPGDVQRNLRWLVMIFAVLIGVSLFTTQMAARRAISSTHLVYRGVHLVGMDSLTIGAGFSGADVRLQTVSSGQTPWLLRLRSVGSDWQIEPLSGIEQVRVRARSTQAIKDEYSVASSAVLVLPDDGIEIISPWGEVLDTLRLTKGGLESSGGSVWAFEPRNPALSGRFEKQLARGTTLTDLAGTRFASSTVYERYVRIEEVSSGDVINEVQRSLWDRVFPTNRRYLVSASPPFRIGGAAVGQQMLTIRDSAFVEVRNGDGTWRFALLTEWRRTPGAERGVTVLFARNPRPMDTPLPVGVSCQRGAACGAISLRRLPPPVAHVALDNAGFDPDRFGLLGILRLSDGGYDVVLPRAKYRVEAGKSHMVAVPVTDLEQEHADGTVKEQDSSSRWILLSATGQRDTILNVMLIAVALALLLFAVYFAVQTFPFGDSAGLTVAEERAITAGLTALLGLVLTRVTVGARVAFFDPFLDRGIATAVGLCVAIAVVIFGLLTWSAWVPAFFATARSLLSGHSSPRQVVRSALRWTASLGSIARSPRWLKAVGSAALSLILLTISTGSAAWMGLLSVSIVLLAWVLVAWIFAFTGNHFDTYERGAHAVIEQLSPSRTPLALSRSKPKSRFGQIWRIFIRVPELNVFLAFLFLLLSQVAPGPGLAVCTLYFIVAGTLVVRRMHGKSYGGQPDHVAAGVGVAVFGVIIALLRGSSANGSLGAFVLVIFVALASVRVGRAVGARLGARGRDRGTVTLSEWLVESLLLTTPLFLLVVLAPIDMGLFLVLVIPIGCATLLATGTRAAGSRRVVPFAAMALLLIMVKMVVFPSMQPIRDAPNHAAQAEAFARMSSVGGLRVPLLSTPLDRAAARSVATRSPELAEALVVAARPGTARDLLIPSVEQIWGAKAYARAGLWGKGLGQAVIGGRGVAEAVSYAENTFSVFVLAEHGAVGGMLVLALYLMLTGAVAALIFCREVSTPSDRASRALFLVVALIVVIPACYVALSNIGLVPITGQNMPFLGLNSWSDVAISAGVFGILITGTLRLLEVK